jgi:hypothetical protein
MCWKKIEGNKHRSNKSFRSVKRGGKKLTNTLTVYRLLYGAKWLKYCCRSFTRTDSERQTCTDDHHFTKITIWDSSENVLIDVEFNSTQLIACLIVDFCTLNQLSLSNFKETYTTCLDSIYYNNKNKIWKKTIKN